MAPLSIYSALEDSLLSPPFASQELPVGRCQPLSLCLKEGGLHMPRIMIAFPSVVRCFCAMAGRPLELMAVEKDQGPHGRPHLEGDGEQEQRQEWQLWGRFLSVLPFPIHRLPFTTPPHRTQAYSQETHVLAPLDQWPTPPAPAFIPNYYSLVLPLTRAPHSQARVLISFPPRQR